MTAEQEYRQFKSVGWKLTDPESPGVVYDDIMDWHTKLFELAIAWFTEEHGYPPNLPLRPSCQTNDWSDSAVTLDHVEGTLTIVKDMLDKMTTHPAMGYQWGGVGYLISGVEWDEIPKWAQDYLRTRFADGVEI